MDQSKTTVEEIRMLLKYMSKGYKVPQEIYDVVFATAKREIEDKKKVVIIKRDPDVESRRIQAVYVKVIETKENATAYQMEIHPTQVGGFGADFDGDTMGIFVPITNESQKEAREKMISAVTNSSINSPNFQLSKEMLTGLFTLTYNERGTSTTVKDPKECVKLDIAQKVKIKFKGQQETTAGRVVFNTNLPEWYPYVNVPVDKKVLNKILGSIIARSHNEFVVTLDNLMKTSFYYATIYPKSFALDMMELTPELIRLRNTLNDSDDVGVQSEIIKQIERELLQHLKKNIPDLYDQVASGAAKGTDQLRQIMVCKGIIADPSGNVLPPILRPIVDGYTPREYFDASAGSRMGTISRALKTAAGGYSARKVMFATGNVQLNDKVYNCRTSKGMSVNLTPDLFKRMQGRWVLTGRDQITPITEQMIGTRILLRTPIYCTTERICHVCYGELGKQLNSRNCGVIAAQTLNISERIMKCSTGLIQTKNSMKSFDDIWEGTEWSDD